MIPPTGFTSDAISASSSALGSSVNTNDCGVVDGKLPVVTPQLDPATASPMLNKFVVVVVDVTGVVNTNCRYSPF